MHNDTLYVVDYEWSHNDEKPRTLKKQKEVSGILRGIKQVGATGLITEAK